jgi:DNA-binding response OmpR family regulator
MSTVLVVDDDFNTLAFVKDTLEGSGGQVQLASSAAAALELLKRRTVDAVLLEVLLPQKEGVETIVELRQQWPDLPIVAMSGGGALIRGDQVLSYATAAGASAALHKPFSATELFYALAQCFGGQPR